DALEALRRLPFRDVGGATVDHHRALRQGVPEVIFGEPKTAQQIVAIAQEIVQARQNVLVTRLDAEKAAVVAREVEGFRYVPVARVGGVTVAPVPKRDAGPVAVVTAGTSDIGVAEEACETLGAVGLEPLRIYDVGVAGIHRFLHRLDEISSASAV